MKKFAAEFKQFIMRGNVMDMAVGVIVATAFGKITTSLVNDLFMPFISWLFGTRDMSALNLIARPEVVENGEVVQEAIVIGFGNFVATRSISTFRAAKPSALRSRSSSWRRSARS